MTKNQHDFPAAPDEPKCPENIKKNNRKFRIFHYLNSKKIFGFFCYSKNYPKKYFLLIKSDVKKHCLL